ncbi:MAG: hypothetical protein A2808_04080 [Candidatus Moranbacteria bacterium RIFCSPHIGHO2_01_FULL_55_24]|nr:MAG: hypothetical protein A2808_04080 [Candidatus Moranbacteria bacterium RIFCSPHIGHO2_01_FULL_55_24]
MLDTLLLPFFLIHDFLSAFLAKHLFQVKRFLLVVAHLALFGLFFPEFRRDFGQLSGNLLIGILFLSPVSQIFRMRLLLQMMSLRRELGIMMAYLATVHGLGYLLDPDWFQYVFTVPLEAGLFTVPAPYLFGMIAYLLTLPLLLTSNNLANRFLGGKNWKRLHRIVYLMFIFAVLHRFFMRSGSDGTYTIAFAQTIFLLGTYALAKILAWKNLMPFLPSSITLVADRYKAFQAAKASQTALQPAEKPPVEPPLP